MMTGRGRAVAVASTLAGIAVLLAAGWCLRDVAVEEWYIHRLGSKDPIDLRRVIERLQEMRSTRAIPRILEVLPVEEQGILNAYFQACGGSSGTRRRNNLGGVMQPFVSSNSAPKAPRPGSTSSR
jgi:hypothetical protein